MWERDKTFQNIEKARDFTLVETKNKLKGNFKTKFQKPK
jgi:hypothetical protein